jgi:hypothetical protein
MNVRRRVPLPAALFLVLVGCGDPTLAEDTQDGPLRGPEQDQSDEQRLEVEHCASIEDRNALSDDAGLNLLRSIHRGGPAKVVEITATVGGEEDMDLVYSRDLEGDCNQVHEPQGALCDLDDSAVESERFNRYGGPSWGNYGEDVRGILIIDVCNDGSCSAMDFNELRVFQSYPRANVTHIRLYAHPELGDVAPAWDDDGWTLLVDDTPVGIGKDMRGDTELVSEPTALDVTTDGSRYLRVDVANDGSHGGDVRFIDLRSIKAFCRGI